MSNNEDIDYKPLDRDKEYSFEDEEVPIWPKVLGILSVVLLAVGSAWYFLVYRTQLQKEVEKSVQIQKENERVYLFSKNEKVCILGKFDGVVVQCGTDMYGNNEYNVLYATEHGTKYGSYGEAILVSGACPKDSQPIVTEDSDENP